MPDDRIRIKVWRDQRGVPYLIRVSQSGQSIFFYKKEGKISGLESFRIRNKTPNAYERLRMAVVDYFSKFDKEAVRG